MATAETSHSSISPEESALERAYVAQFSRTPDGLKALRHSLLRGQSADLRRLAGKIAENQPVDAVPVTGGASGGASDSAAGSAADSERTTQPRAAWLAMVAQVGWLQGETDAATLTRFRAVRNSFGISSLTEADVAAYLAAGGASLAPDERAELHAHPTLKATARASVASDAAGHDHGIGSSQHLAAISSILALPEAMSLRFTSGATGPTGLTAKVSLLEKAKAKLRSTDEAPAAVTVIVTTGSPEAVTATLASLKLQSHSGITVTVQEPGETIASTVTRAPGDLLLFLAAGSFAGPALATSLAGAASAAPVLAVVPSAQRVDSSLLFAPANSLLRFADPTSALVRRSAFAEVGPLLDVPAAEALDEFIERLRRSRGKDAVARVAAPTLVLHAAIPLPLTDPVIPTQDWRAAFRAATLDTGGDGESVEPGDVVLPFAVLPSPDPKFDVIFAGTLSRAGWKGGSQESMLQEIRALSRRGLRLGLVHLETARVGGPGPGQLSPAFQRLIDTGAVTRLTIFDRVSADVVTVRYPPVLQFTPDLPHGFDPATNGISAGRVIIEANQGPAETDGTDRRYLVADCDRTALAIFGRRATWYPQGPLIRRQLEVEGVEPAQLGDVDLPGLLEPADWSVERAPLAGRRPVVGRYSRDHPHKWPDDWNRVLETYGSADFDFTSMGGHDALDELRGEQPLPATWTLLGYDELPPREFLAGIDFFAYFHRSNYVEAFGRAVAEAMASGAVVILPPTFEPVFGTGAVYCAASELAATVARLTADPVSYAAAASAGQDYAARNFGYERYAGVIESLRASAATRSRG